MSGPKKPWYVESAIIDYFALLGITPDATSEMVDGAYRKLIKQFHPDRYEGLAPQFQREAQRMTTLLSAAAEILRGDLRTQYESELASWEGPVSTDGFPAEDLSAPYFSAFSVLQPRASLAKEIAGAIGYQPAIFKIIQDQYVAAENPSAELTEAYREALAQRDLALSIEETFAWEGLGYHNREVRWMPYDYAANVESDIQKARTAVIDDLGVKLALAYSGQLQLEGPLREQVANAVTESPGTALELWTGKVLESFEKQVEKVQEFARQREDLVARRLELLPIAYVPDGQVLHRNFAVSLLVRSKPTWFVFAVERDKVVSAEGIITKDELERSSDPAIAAQIIARGINLIHVSAYDDIEHADQLHEVADRHHKAYFAAHPEELETGM